MKKERDIHLQVLLMESALTPASEPTRWDSVPSIPASVQSALLAPTSDRSWSPYPVLAKKAGRGCSPASHKGKEREPEDPQGAVFSLQTVARLHHLLSCQAPFETCLLPWKAEALGTWWHHPCQRPFRPLRTYCPFQCRPCQLLRCPIQGKTSPGTLPAVTVSAALLPTTGGAPPVLI